MNAPIKFLADYEIHSADELKFEVKPCNSKQYIITFSILGLILLGLLLLVIFSGFNEWMVVYAIGICALEIFIIPIIWHAVFKNFIKNDLVPAMESYSNQNGTENFIDHIKNSVKNVLGLRFDPHVVYYLEAEPLDVDLTDNSVLLKHHAFDITTTALGFSFLLTMVVSWFLQVSADSWYVLLYLAIAIAFASPIIVSPLVPVLWTLEDTAVKSINKDHLVQRFGDRMRFRVFDRIIGKGGIFLGFSTILNQVIKINLEAHQLSTVGQFLWTGLIFLGLVLMMGIPGVLCTMRYLRLHHQENVNLTRNILKTVLPLGYTTVKSHQS